MMASLQTPNHDNTACMAAQDCDKLVEVYKRMVVAKSQVFLMVELKNDGVGVRQVEGIVDDMKGAMKSDGKNDKRDGGMSI